MRVSTPGIHVNIKSQYQSWWRYWIQQNLNIKTDILKVSISVLNVSILIPECLHPSHYHCSLHNSRRLTIPSPVIKWFPLHCTSLHCTVRFTHSLQCVIKGICVCHISEQDVRWRGGEGVLQLTREPKVQWPYRLTGSCLIYDRNNHIN